MNQIKVNWVFIINEHMLKSKRLADYRFPYAISVSKLIDYFGIDVTNERNDPIKAVSEINTSTLTKMGFHKIEDKWVVLKGKDPQAEHEASNLHNEDEDEAVPMDDDSPATQSVHEEAAANAIVAYQAPEYRGEPMSIFERQVLYRLDVMSAKQRAYFETTHARFQHLDDQIEGVQAQLAELYYKDQ